MPSRDIKAYVRHKAQKLGFDAVGFAPGHLPNEIQQHLQRFLELQYHGTMGWMEEKAKIRSSPHHLWPEVRSVIVLGMNYGPDHNPLDDLTQKNKGMISVYARNRDYHDILKGRLKQLAGQIVSQLGGEVKVFVDTAPVMEKALANLSGIGWQGKHTCLVSREHGSWLFLGIIYSTLDISPDKPEPDHCGSCSACIDICPTNAFPEPGKIDARRCISYLTIEHKGHIPAEFRKAMGNRIYGCDDCLAICPWNKFASEAQEAGFHAREALNLPDLADLLQLNDDKFRKLFAASPIKRIGRDRFIRNVLIAAGNSGAQDLISHIIPHLTDPAPTVRAMAVWALGQLAPHELSRYQQQQHKETEEGVLKEWQRAITFNV